ncbi:stage II sporulation protein P [Alkalihalobacillus pseudalcaliphilus]|uniref:stage II sporulation protein P n=1 Tax=Alkalihalobacillus pseudalcaliphilus TaxID=79884 RepID=UPI00064DBB09|nr:stage II sporulation protein P [Alkalihalobacillus pseudalcaliphilus]KMK77027.1 stage II sporulation protein P [Alkalihalobacillus pseudalcaliphilus]
MRHFYKKFTIIKTATAYFAVVMISICILLTSLVTISDFQSRNLHRSMEGINGQFLLHVMSMENHFLGQVLPDGYSTKSLTSFTFELATNIELGDFRSLLGREIPGLNSRDVRIIVAGEGTDITNLPYESPPPLETILEDREAVKDWAEDEEQNQEEKPPTISEGDDPVVLLYHSHSWESFLPHLPGEANPNSAASNEVNIIDVGHHLKEALEKQGIKTVIDTTNMTKKLNELGKGTGYSYTASRGIVQSYLDQYESIDYVIDLHRDSARYDITHTELDGEDFARLMFVVGESHSNYEINEKLATEMHKRLGDQLSRGVFGKDKTQGNGIYNQDLSKGALLVEFGGVDNHMNELHRSAEKFAEIFSEYYFEQLEKDN